MVNFWFLALYRDHNTRFLRRFPFSCNVGAYIWNRELGSIGKGDHGLMDTLTVGEVHHENMVCSSLLGWAPIEPFGPFLVEQSGVFFSALEDLSWFVRLLHKIYLPFIYASNMALSNQYIIYRYIWTYESKLRRKFPKVLDLETCLLSEKAAR